MKTSSIISVDCNLERIRKRKGTPLTRKFNEASKELQFCVQNQKELLLETYTCLDNEDYR